MATQHSSGCIHLCKDLSCGLPETLSLGTELGKWGRRRVDFREASVLDITTRPCLLPSWAPPRASEDQLMPRFTTLRCVRNWEGKEDDDASIKKVGNHFCLSLKGFPLMLSCYKSVKRHTRIINICICFCCHFKYILGAHHSKRDFAFVSENTFLLK